LTPLLQLWEIRTKQLACDMISGKLQARVACIDRRILDESFAGRELDAALLEEFPAAVETCGENGEFHSLVYDGPIFRATLAIETGEIHRAGDFVYRDLLPCRVSSR
jgi:diphthamide synthase (EF-2-diphthine--ammonia ligase)